VQSVLCVLRGNTLMHFRNKRFEALLSADAIN